MRITNVTSHRDITRLCVVVTLIVLALVAVIPLLYLPRAHWLGEFVLHSPMVTILAYGTVRIIGQQMLRNHALTQELQRLVSRDKLTNVATRDFFFTKLADMPNSEGVTLMVDIDHFKQVNDTYGHPTGDKVIAHVASRMAGAVGARDLVCRFGGEEFVIFLENATQTIAWEVAERIRARVADTPVESDGARVNVTVSIGGSRRMAVSEIEEAVREADAALYRAKQQGRNRTVMAGEKAPMPAVRAAEDRSAA